MASTEAQTAEDVHPDHDAPTPDNIDDWSEEQLEEWNRLRDEEYIEEAQRQREELSEKQEQALAALRDPETDDTAMVELGRVELIVKTYADEAVEDKLVKLQGIEDEALGQREIFLIRNEVPQLMEWFVEDPDEYANEEIWRDYARRYGIGDLTKAWLRVVEPYFDKNEDDRVVQKFRSERGRGSSR